jgi:hypothetical protein
MTLTVAWVRRVKRTNELVIISDSRLRSRGAMDQAQKIIPLQRGDCALAFCGDTGVAYPFFIQASSVLNNFIRTRTRGSDVAEVRHLLGRVLNNIIQSWDLKPDEKRDELKDTRILFAGWSWRDQEFKIGFFRFIDKEFIYQETTNPITKPWRERKPSLVVIGDYIEEYMRILGRIVGINNPTTNRWSTKEIDLQYEPLEALNELLNDTQDSFDYPKIGGRPQAVKVYPFSSTLPIVVRCKHNEHYLFGRKLFEWEKTEHPIAVISPGKTKFIYPMSSIPVPAEIGNPVNPIRAFIRLVTSRGKT